jgi:predicted S18 family serine protease
MLRSCAKYNVPIDLIVRGHQAISDAAKIVDGVDKMITKYSSQPSEALQNTSKKTAITNSLWADLKGKGKTSRLMEAEMISGQAEGQLLQILLKLSGGNWAVRNWMVF